MPSRSSTILLFAALLLAQPGPAAAAPLGRSFTYQGQLQQAGAPVDGVVSLRFSLWDAAGTGDPPSGGTMIGGVQVIANAPVTGGVFSVALNGNNEFGAQAFNGEARWLQVEVCADSTCAATTVLGPRQAITAAPYALGPWQMEGSDVGYTQGRVGIGTTTPAAPLHLRRTVPYMIMQDLSANSQQAGYLGFWNSSSSETGWIGFGSPGSPHFTMLNNRSGGGVKLWAGGAERVSVLSSGQVGIGTTNPVAKLQVVGDIQFGPAGELSAVGASTDLRIIRGRVSTSGLRVFGSGFTSTRTGTGVYSIDFTPDFVDQPSIVATCHSSGADRIAMISSPLAGSCTIRVVSGSGTAVDAYFDLVVIGLR
jgi:hypothetical protein